MGIFKRRGVIDRGRFSVGPLMMEAQAQGVQWAQETKKKPSFFDNFLKIARDVAKGMNESRPQENRKPFGAGIRKAPSSKPCKGC